MVKIEGGTPMLPTIEFLTQRGIPVCGHLGLTPQSVHQLGGYRVQGRGDSAAQLMVEEAARLERAGAGMIVLEAIPSGLARDVRALHLGAARRATLPAHTGRDVEGLAELRELSLHFLVRLELAWKSGGMPADDRAGGVVQVPPMPAVTVSLDQEPKRPEAPRWFAALGRHLKRPLQLGGDRPRRCGGDTPNLSQ